MTKILWQASLNKQVIGGQAAIHYVAKESISQERPFTRGINSMNFALLHFSILCCSNEMQIDVDTNGRTER